MLSNSGAATRVRNRMYFFHFVPLRLRVSNRRLGQFDCELVLKSVNVPHSEVREPTDSPKSPLCLS